MSDNDNVEKLTQALIFAFATANDVPYAIPLPVMKSAAVMLDRCGVKQTDDVAENVSLPGWILERAREEAAPIAESPDHHAIQADSPRVATAPKQPKRIPKNARGVIVTAPTT
ncbi:hypothetical protein SEA_ENALISNAILO_21 [Gordonia phage EnalisNailo]|uniref:Uncharacterized protein n=1 Tax=Gordonia phage BritBrat TaxID=1838064 RepID=A0A166XZ69_9CAUD|nr:hypothetical protein BH769_gp21 [Gordonia phage BritBrat]AXH48351.1 hypothetical protein SEA_POLLUX_21 [Gordonia phage Pollux]AZV00672.1 hypothetical protein SEA_LILAS_21 [Gordonia phage Lilas]QAY17548.1 hypothetical protein SEA_BRADISSA_21 [Gordonia phage Bradissa]QAY17624.1 hypothetical protein SEA_EMSQUAREDA_21 [Gordonia phage EMsquaredA]QDB74373.1 hypothetical protein SEA_ENALISNAILO_21 [Gordonia phage EnalisNailo]QDP45106.1 hypothetical protein SEA_MARTEENA_21 [Gordonia phage Marteena